MPKPTSPILPILLALAHYTSAIPAPILPRATGGTNAILPRATGFYGGTNAILPRATGFYPDIPAPSPSIQISYGLAPSASQVAPIPVGPSPIAPIPIEPSPIVGSPYSIKPDPEEFDKRQLDNETDPAPLPLPPIIWDPLPPAPENETAPEGIYPFERRQLDNETESAPAPAPLPTVWSPLPGPPENETDYPPATTPTVWLPPPGPPENETSPDPWVYPIDKRNPAPVLPPDSYLQPDATTIFVSAAPTPAPPPPSPSAAPADLGPYFDQLLSLGWTPPVQKRNPAPVLPAASYDGLSAVTIVSYASFQSPASVPSPVEPISTIPYHVTASIPPPAQPTMVSIPPAQPTEVSIPPPAQPTVISIPPAPPTQPSPSAWSPQPVDSLIPEIQSAEGLLFPYAATPDPTPASAYYARRQVVPTDSWDEGVSWSLPPVVVETPPPQSWWQPVETPAARLDPLTFTGTPDYTSTDWATVVPVETPSVAPVESWQPTITVAPPQTMPASVTPYTSIDYATVY